ncbi:response regulator transcription factor [Sphingobacterium bambusae]|uniref:Response regulator transcription factor n=1 Tax=Sphingobacterium bambusae TaxID=662858 RepID=A0ABW6B9S1_9SPHI|nr:LuxR C-terminal-related transcriptional regulator [Sphingobacterium bambusae]WPL48557.1 LuxR C-terminal-related transcriptional regulator [Sphingobacterium bambusae]
MYEKEDPAKLLSDTLLTQHFSPMLKPNNNDDQILEHYKRLAASYVTIENSLVVLSDFVSDKSYIYTGTFGEVFGFDPGISDIASAFERFIFDSVHPDDLLERHGLELSFLQFQKAVPSHERPKFTSRCKIRMKTANGSYVLINHRMQYMESFANGNIWLAFCIYAPCIEKSTVSGIDGHILNEETGTAQSISELKTARKEFLTKRETEVIQLLAQGLTSKEIASRLNMALYTTFRHRQNILKKLNVKNTTEAVRIGIILGIIGQQT